MKFLRAFLKKMMSTTMLSSGAVLAASLFATPVLAKNSPLPVTVTPTAAEQPAADYSIYQPGTWRRLDTEENNPRAMSLAALMRAEQQTGAVFCKMRRADGWYTNFIDCSQRGLINRLVDMENGRMSPPRNDSVDENLNEMVAYDISANRHDRELTQGVYAAHMQMVALASTPAYRMAVAGARTPRAATPTLVARNIPMPIARPSQDEIDRLIAARDGVAPIEVASADPVVTAATTGAAPVEVASVDPAPAAVALPVTTPEIETRALPAARTVVADNRSVTVPVHRVRTTVIKPPVRVAQAATPTVRRAPVAAVTATPLPTPVAVASVETRPATPVVAPVQTASAADAFTSAIQRAALTSGSRPRPSAAFAAANDEDFVAMLRTRQPGPVLTMPSRVSKEPTTPNRKDFNTVAIAANDRFEPVATGPVPNNDNEWVTARGRRVEFEVFKNGRFRIAKAPQPMAA